VKIIVNIRKELTTYLLRETTPVTFSPVPISNPNHYLTIDEIGTGEHDRSG